MRVDDFLAEYVGIDDKSDDYIKAIKLLSSMLLEDGLLKPDDDLENIYGGCVSWVDESKEFKEAFDLYVARNIVTAHEFLKVAKVPEDMLDIAISDLSDLLDFDLENLRSDIYPLIEEYFDGSIEDAVRLFTGTYQY